ncbi:MAG TPA: efflux RND transporter periplasmic adaptor subunit [Thermoanaerobaculia bacterium]|nr:efflux RND transporter periplasmic adaptor subunit [Thermoanaerobaculia bacterium]
MDVVREDSTKRKRRRNVRRLLIAGGIAIVGVAGFCYLKPALPSLSRSQAWIDTVRRGAFRQQVRGSGTLVPEDIRWIPAVTDGRIERVIVLAGETVRADTVLIEISNPELLQAARDAELQLNAAEAELRAREIQVERDLLIQRAATATARAEYEEARLRASADAELARAGLVSPLMLKFSQGKEAQLAVRVDAEEKRLELSSRGQPADLGTARARVGQLRTLLDLKRQQVDALHVRAGRDGVLQQVSVEAGQRVTAGTILAKVAAPYPLKAVLQIAQVEAARIASGQNVEIDTHTGIVRGAVMRIDPAVRNGSVTIDVRLPRDLPAGARPDLSVDALIDVDHAGNVLFVGRPVQAEPNGSVVLFRLGPDGTFAARTRIRVGRASYNAIEILGGLAEGDRVVLSDTSTFDRFDRIRIVN